MVRSALSIGDFSRVTHLSVKALRHYHAIGLLPPAEVDGAEHEGDARLSTVMGA